MGATRVLHIASHEINVGDGALIDGIRGQLDAVADRPIDYQPLDVVPLGSGAAAFDPAILADYDLVLIGGGGTIDGSVNHTESGMALPLGGAAIRQSPTPLAFVAIGYNLFPGQTLHCRGPLIDLLDACRQRGFPFSVRNDSSHERLVEAVGDAARDVVEVPDPGFFIRPDRSYVVPQMTGRRPTVLLQLAGDNLERRLGAAPCRRWFARRPERTRRGFVDQIADLIAWLVTQRHAEVVLAPHITRDLRLTAEVIDRLPMSLARPHVRVLGVPHPSHAPQFFQAYAEADLVIGMRGHSVICAVGLRVPCVAISTHAKVAGFMRKCELSRWSIPWSEHFGSEVRQACAQLLDAPSAQLAARDAATANFHDRFAQFMAHAWRLTDTTATRPDSAPRSLRKVVDRSTIIT
jgi:polysaccharide pyruvyl transferase WcaK-like protein